MKLENQVCSLEQGKKFKELSVLGESHFSWFGDESHIVMDNGNVEKKIPMSVSKWVQIDTTIPINNMEKDYRDDVPSLKNPICPAFTVAELMTMLPASITHGGVKRMLHVGKSTCGSYECGYIREDAELSSRFFKIFNAPTLAQACAAMLIYLLENGHTTPEEVNQRLTNN